MISLELENFSLAQIAASGQCFRMNPVTEKKVWADCIWPIHRAGTG